MEIKKTFIHRIFIAVLFISFHFGCNEQDLLYNSDLLWGEWQMYGTVSSDGQIETWNYENDPVLTLKFYGTDSVKYFTLFGTYSAEEELGEIIFHVIDRDRDVTHRHEVIRLDTTELWLREITIPENPLEIRFKKK